MSTLIFICIMNAKCYCNFQEFTDQLIKEETLAEDQKDAFKVTLVSILSLGLLKSWGNQFCLVS